MHKHFTRGDKKKCLQMRSIVKKPSAVSIMGISNHQPNAGDVMASHLLQSNRQALYYSDARMLSGMGLDGGSFNMPLANYPGGLQMTYSGLGMQMPMLRSNYLNSGLDLMYQMPMYNMIGSAIDNNSTSVPQNPEQEPFLQRKYYYQLRMAPPPAQGCALNPAEVWVFYNVSSVNIDLH